MSTLDNQRHRPNDSEEYFKQKYERSGLKNCIDCCAEKAYRTSTSVVLYEYNTTTPGWLTHTLER